MHTRSGSFALAAGNYPRLPAEAAAVVEEGEPVPARAQMQTHADAHIGGRQSGRVSPAAVVEGQLIRVGALSVRVAAEGRMEEAVEGVAACLHHVDVDEPAERERRRGEEKGRDDKERRR
jgi:hypothetical protein